MNKKKISVNCTMYNVGVDEFSEWDLEKLNLAAFKWIVYAYETGSYDGSGVMVGKDNDGKYHMANLGHCSCYGPTEDGLDEPFELENIMADLECKPKDYDYSYKNAVKVKVATLTRQRNKK